MNSKDDLNEFSYLGIGLGAGCLTLRIAAHFHFSNSIKLNFFGAAASLIGGKRRREPRSPAIKS